MKALLQPLVLIVLAGFSLLTPAVARSETNAVYLKMILTSNDVQSAVRLLPEVEKLWPQHPKAYFESVQQAIRTFGGAITNPAAKQSLVNVFTNMIQKPLPEDNGEAAVCVESKHNAISQCLNYKEIRDNKARWVEIAKFIGEVRSRSIPNYQNRTVMNSIANVGPQELQRIEIEHQRNSAMDSLQVNLRSVESGLMWSLQNITGRIPPNKSANTNFFAQVISAAHLNDDEAALFRGKSAP